MYIQWQLTLKFKCAGYGVREDRREIFHKEGMNGVAILRGKARKASVTP